MKNTILTFIFLATSSLVSAKDAAHTKHLSDHLPQAPMPGQLEGNMKGAIKKARVFFIEPKDGAILPTQFKVKMGVEGMKIRPAGEAIDDMTSGHHHLIIDAEAADAGVVVPADEKHLHFGKGQAETELNLKPGVHKLTLQFADGAHRSFGPSMRQTIRIQVQ